MDLPEFDLPELNLPPVDDFGTEFPYEKFKGQYTTKASFHRVAWDQSYREAQYFQNDAQLNAFLDSRPHREFDDFSYLKMGEPITVAIPFNEVIEWNYIRVQNFKQHVGGSVPDKIKDYYYFITDVQHVAPETTRLMLQLDVWQTYVRSVEWGDAFVEQGHIGIADSSVEIGADSLLLNPEGLNLGADYRIDGTTSWNISAGANSMVCVVSASDLEGSDYGTLDNPNLKTAGGNLMEDLPNGAAIYIFKNPVDFTKYMRDTSDQSWVTQAIISITAIPAVVEDVDQNQFDTVNLNGTDVFKPKQSARIPVRTNFISVSAAETWTPQKFRHLKKFSVHPYSFFEGSTYTGEPMVLKRELMTTRKQGNVTVSDYDVYIHVAPPAPRLAIVPRAYNSINGTGKEDGEFLNVAQWISNFPQFSVVNSGYIGTMAAQAHSLSQSYKSADWTQQRALAGANTAYDQGTSAIDMANQMTGNQVASMNAQTDLQNTTTAIRAVKDGAFAIGGGIMSGSKAGPVGMGAGAIGGAISAANTGIDAIISTNQNTQSNNIATNLASQQNMAQTGNMAFVRDTNLDLAKFGLKGDYANTIAQINAKVEDAKMTQPSTAGTTGGDAFMLAMFGWKFHVKHKRVNNNAMEVIGNHWLNYGYQTSRYAKLPSDLMVMSSFTYWKCADVFIKSARCPEPVKRALAGIIEKGVRVWRNPEELENGTTTGIANLPIMGNYLR